VGAHAARETHRTNGRVKPTLSLVPTVRTRSATPARSAAARLAASRRLFRMFTFAVAVIAVLAVGRVWLSVQAAEASIAASGLRSDIQNERYRGDMLEVRQSALGSPSRIRAIAGNAMQMSSSRKVTYLRLNTNVDASIADSDDVADSSAKRAVARLMDLAAGEAQVLLVGSIGLARAKYASRT